MIKARAKLDYIASLDEMVLFAYVKDHFNNKDYRVKISLEEKKQLLEFLPAIETDLLPPSELLKTIFNALWEGGMRPDGFKDFQNELAATKHHLKDMRRLAFASHAPYNIDELG